MNRSLFKHVVVVCLLCACLLTVMQPVSYAKKYDSKEKISDVYCSDCNTNNKIYRYNGVVVDSKPIDNKDDETHSVEIRDEIWCENPNCPYKGIIMSFNSRNKNVKHSINIKHSGKNVIIKCSKCDYYRKVDHKSYIILWGKRIGHDSVTCTYKDSTYHNTQIYDLYQCTDCSATEKKHISSIYTPHNYRKMTQQLTGRLYQIWDECQKCHHQKNKRTEYR